MNCGSCHHWRQQPADPANLTAPAQGECRGQPPQRLPLLLLDPRTGQTVQQIQTSYVVLPEQFPACALYELSPASLSGAGNHKH
jgi:hypothetical protein